MSETERDAITDARKLLKSHGYVVLREKSYHQAQERQRVADALRRSAEEEAARVRHWASTELHNEIRQLQARCTALYGAARAHGATAEELAAIEWPATGTNCPACMAVPNAPVLVVPGHPHTDPKGGRTECNTCGKWVFECAHSCKGVPVTDSAWERWRQRHQGGAS